MTTSMMASSQREDAVEGVEAAENGLTAFESNNRSEESTVLAPKSTSILVLIGPALLAGFVIRWELILLGKHC